eukprot:gene6291-211_t
MRWQPPRGDLLRTFAAEVARELAERSPVVGDAGHSNPGPYGASPPPTPGGGDGRSWNLTPPGTAAAHRAPTAPLPSKMHCAPAGVATRAVAARRRGAPPTGAHRAGVRGVRRPHARRGAVVSLLDRVCRTGAHAELCAGAAADANANACGGRPSRGGRPARRSRVLSELAALRGQVASQQAQQSAGTPWNLAPAQAPLIATPAAPALTIMSPILALAPARQLQQPSIVRPTMQAQVVAVPAAVPPRVATPVTDVKWARVATPPAAAEAQQAATAAATGGVAATAAAGGTTTPAAAVLVARAPPANTAAPPMGASAGGGAAASDQPRSALLVANAQPAAQKRGREGDELREVVRENEQLRARLHAATAGAGQPTGWLGSAVRGAAGGAPPPRPAPPGAYDPRGKGVAPHPGGGGKGAGAPTR